ncbi:helix-turn-helix domain-containing protein [Aestuariivirga sp.]|uniref:helix-turn-helix domain-containing protein n=1 Tax=Aestuariivirga sp. TaxID=2650926 RepID=UPI0039E4D2AF
MGYPKFGFIELLNSISAIPLASLFPEEYRSLVSALIEARAHAGKTQTDLAKMLKRPQSFVSKVESGERRLDAAEFIMIMGMLGADIASALSIILRKPTEKGKRR